MGNARYSVRVTGDVSPFSSLSPSKGVRDITGAMVSMVAAALLLPPLKYRWVYVQTDGMKPWLAQARELGAAPGVLYTTWVGNYNDLGAFGKAALGG